MSNSLQGKALLRKILGSVILRNMGFFRSFIAVLARICLSGIFLASGINKILYWKEMEKRFLSILGDWQTHTVSSPMLQIFFNFSVVWAPFILMTATFLEILGGLLLLFGIREKLGAVLLAIVLLPTTVLMQHFWFEGNMQELQISLFLRDIAIFGGLLIVILHGAHGNPPILREDDSFLQ